MGGKGGRREGRRGDNNYVGTCTLYQGDGAKGVAPQGFVGNIGFTEIEVLAPMLY